MRVGRVFVFAAALACCNLVPQMRAGTPEERVVEIQQALAAQKLDGWLFYDFRGSDPLALRILKLDEHAIGSRRWFYYITPNACTAIVHRIEPAKLSPLPGKHLEYSSWKELHSLLRNTLTNSKQHPRIAMQYSPMNDIPYMSRVDAGTIELVRSFGVDVVSSAELVQQFEAVWSPEQLQMHREASDKMHRIFFDGFGEIARRIRANEPTTEYDIEQFILRRWEEEGMGGGEHPDAIVSVNANTANPHYVPTREKALPIKRGDFVLFDLASKLHQPHAVFTDQTWTGYVGEEVPDEYRKIFNIVRDARDAAIEFVRKNVRDGKMIRGAEVDDIARGVIARAGYADQFTHRTGHSIGEEVHGNGVNIDNFETRDSRRITPGVCFSIEPCIYLPDKFGVRSEVDVYVSDKDIEVTGQPIQTEVVAILKP